VQIQCKRAGEGGGGVPETELPVHWSVHLQLPPLPHAPLVQQRMSDGSSGQKPAVDTPPAEAQFAVETHTPGVPFTLQRPLTAAWAVAERRREVTARNFIIGNEWV